MSLVTRKYFNGEFVTGCLKTHATIESHLKSGMSIDKAISRTTTAVGLTHQESMYRYDNSIDGFLLRGISC